MDFKRPGARASTKAGWASMEVISLMIIIAWAILFSKMSHTSNYERNFFTVIHRVLGISDQKPSTLLKRVLIAITVAFLGGCSTTTAPSNLLLLNEGRGDLMRQVMERKDKIIQLSSPELDGNKPVLLLLHGATDDPTEMMNIVREWRGKYNVFLYSYNYHNRVRKSAEDLTSEMKKLKSKNPFLGTVTVLVYSYSAIVFRGAVIMGDDRTLFQDASLIQLVPTAGGSFLALSMNFPIVRSLVSWASPSSAAENPYGSISKKLWDGDGNKKFYEVIKPQRIHTILLERDSHSLAGVKNKNVQRRYKNGIGPNVVVIPRSAGVTHDDLPNQPAALVYLRKMLELPHDPNRIPIRKPEAKNQPHQDRPHFVEATATSGRLSLLPVR
jgi:hypothetical protein